MFTADQLVIHAVGDYIIQNDWMAQNKTKRSWPCIVHVVTYTLPFLFLTQSWLALAVICGTHFLIDRFGLARYVVWIKNGWWHPLTAHGFAKERPDFIAWWLLIIVDNILHVLINAAAIAWL